MLLSLQMQGTISAAELHGYHGQHGSGGGIPGGKLGVAGGAAVAGLGTALAVSVL